MEVVDQFLPEDDLRCIRARIMGSDFPWFFNDSVDYLPGHPGHDAANLDDYQFTHLFYLARGEDGSPRGRLSLEMPLLLPLTRRLGIKRAVRIKANLNPRTERRTQYHFHTDTSQHCWTAVYYLNTNNGLTVFEDGRTVESVENRIVIFDSSVRHTGTSCTDQKVRLVINLNFHRF
ncbi:2OG-Fe(II) oxygenase [Cyanobium sp. CH-040]|uniref:2OG-Fe(II) oxygenase n=1 Tax=Cyanobium sp. CH-040 TaxID=2823708 RepID=UPI0020CC21D2|nr:2OG-Fe(II) oxygenase [Cyanobium sp. CH-040]MCP9927773.1 2OG-Fe(II) oxygenase [Cyanobium sp. CH-040]